MIRSLVTALAALILTATTTNVVSASGGYCTLEKIVCHETYVCYETRLETYKKCVTRYDHCGRPYPAYEVCTREVTVPVRKIRPVVKYVKVCTKTCR